jgi:serine/threonine protein kinase
MRLGRYEILREIAIGGMAELYLARAVGLEGFEKVVVVKRILPQLAAQADFVHMFLDEARIAATLHHPNIVQVYDIGESQGSYFFAMEFLHGADLNRVMRRTTAARRRVPLEHVIGVGIGACAGLHYAHEQLGHDGRPLGLVHRDVSPQNIVVTYDGAVKLVDFGIVKAANRLTSTRHGTLKGKVRYMSPEQCDKQDVDRRSDIFSIAVVLWEISIGRRLNKGPSEFQIMKKIVEQDALAPSTVCPGYPPELERILLKGLRRAPTERYQTAQEMQADLEAFARERKLPVSSITLSKYMYEMFAPEIEAWLVAQRQGTSFAEHLSESYDLKRGGSSSVGLLAQDSTADQFGQKAPAAGSRPAPAPVAPAARQSVLMTVDDPDEPPWREAAAPAVAPTERLDDLDDLDDLNSSPDALLEPLVAGRSSRRPVWIVLGLALAVFATAGIIWQTRGTGSEGPDAGAAGSTGSGAALTVRPPQEIPVREILPSAPKTPASRGETAPGQHPGRDARALAPGPGPGAPPPAAAPTPAARPAAVKPQKMRPRPVGSARTPRPRKGEDLDDPLPRP